MKVYSSLIERLNTQHYAIENIVLAADISRLSMRPHPCKWSIHDNIAHLVRYQQVFIERINRILLTEESFFSRYNPDEDPEFKIYTTLSSDFLINQMDTDRKIIYDLISGLTETQMSRVGIHKKYGPLNIIQWVEFFLLHEAHHIFTIFQLTHNTDLP